MKEKIKRILVKNWWIILVILGIIGWFYWFQVRPSIIYSFCHNEAVSSAVEREAPQGVGYFARKMFDFVPGEVYEAYYKACLRSRGINK